MASASIQSDLYDNLQFIKDYFLDESMGNAPIFGTSINRNFTPKDLNDEDANLICNIYASYNTFSAAYAGDITATTITNNVLTRNVRPSTKTSYVAGSAGALANNDDYYFTEVNLSKLLNPEGRLLSALDAFRVVYTLLDPVVYEVYKGMIANNTEPSATKSFTVQTYRMNNNSTNAVVDTKEKLEDLKNLVKKILRINQPLIVDSDVMAIRRVLRAHELMIHINIALRLKERGVAGADDLLNLCKNMILYANKAMTRDIKSNKSESIPDLAAMLRQRSNKYQQDTKDIDNLDRITSEQRITMKSESERLENRKSREKKSNALLMATLVVTIVVGIATIGAWLTPMDKKQKLSIIAIAFAVGIIVSAILHLVYTTKVEGFALGDPTNNPAATNQGAQTNALLGTLQELHNAQMQAISEYLTNTIQLSLILSTFRTYGVVNHVMMKERVFYSNRATQMDNTNTKLATASDAVYLQQTVQKARIYFFISLMIVISISVLALVILDNIPGIQNIVLVVAAVLIIFMTFAYMMDTSGRVNTSSQKFYWAKPDTTRLY